MLTLLILKCGLTITSALCPGTFLRNALTRFCFPINNHPRFFILLNFNFLPVPVNFTKLGNLPAFLKPFLILLLARPIVYHLKSFGLLLLLYPSSLSLSPSDYHQDTTLTFYYHQSQQQLPARAITSCAFSYLNV